MKLVEHLLQFIWKEGNTCDKFFLGHRSIRAWQNPKEKGYVGWWMSRNWQWRHPSMLHKMNVSHFGLSSKFFILSRLEGLKPSPALSGTLRALRRTPTKNPTRWLWQVAGSSRNRWAASRLRMGMQGKRGSWPRKLAGTAEVGPSCFPQDPGGYSIDCGLSARGMESTRALRRLGVLRAQRLWFLQIPNLPDHPRDAGGILYPRRNSLPVQCRKF